MYNQVLVRFENETSKLWGVIGIIDDKIMCDFHLYDENGDKVPKTADLVRSIQRDRKMVKYLTAKYNNQSIHFTRDDYTFYIQPLL